MVGSGPALASSFGGRSLIYFYVEWVERLRMFIYRDRVKVLYYFVLNYRESGNMYLLQMTVNLLLCGFRSFRLYWTRYYTDLEQMLKKKNFRPNGH